ncbi:MAG TPA: NAD(P)-binding domain-containing protein [Streptosporangiaceae bacterium]|nr:NAD(P)-binding domain-containing protein [Streptosporangiaceae bacterium]
MTHKVAFIGLGIMGSPMAVNLARAGFDVVGHSRRRESADPLLEAGGRWADSVATAVDGADAVITMLPDSPDVDAVALGQDGVVESAAPGTLYIDMSSIRPDVARRVAAAGAERGLRCLDAPVSGGERGAIDGTLSIMIGGAPEDVTAATSLFEVLGSTIMHVGPVGAGQVVKAANQLIVAGNIALVAEALVFLQSQDVDVPAAVTVLGGGLAGSTVLNRKAGSMLAGDFTPGFRIELHDKDLAIYTSSAREAGVVALLGALLAQLTGAAKAQGDGGLDHSALMRVIQRLAGQAP